MNTPLAVAGALFLFVLATVVVCRYLAREDQDS